MLFAILLLAHASPQGVDVECRAAPAEALVGQRYRRHVPSRAKALSGASKVRVLWPGQMTTMEYRGDRLNIRVDHRRLITAVSCG